MFDKITSLVHKKLIAQKKTVSVAESCTGGLLSYLLTSLPGSSKYFLLGSVTYSNAAKEKILGIPKKVIAKYGAVSKETALLMAENLRKKTDSDFTLSVTGIAGPQGATKNKPVGTVFIGLAKKKQQACLKFSFSGGREEIRKKAALEALRLLCAYL